MDNNAWKKDKGLLEEAYKNVYEDREKEDEEEDEEEESEIEEAAPEVDPIGEPVDSLGEPADPIAVEPDELSAEVESLKNLLLHPPKEKIQEYAKSGRLGEYIEMLQQKLKAAESMKKLYSPEPVEA